MNENNMKRCPQCSNQCPQDQLKCGKGRRYFEFLQLDSLVGSIDNLSPSNEPSNQLGHGSHERCGKHGRHGEHSGCGKHGQHGEHNGCGKHGQHGEHNGCGKHAQHNEHSECDKHGQHGEHNGCGKHAHHGEHNGCGEHGRHAHHNACGSHDRHSEQEECNDLLSLLDRCGHFVAHQTGRKRGQYKILRLLNENPQLTQKELQDMLHIQSGSMSEIVMKLERKGLLIRTKDEEDKRRMQLLLTEAGKEAACEEVKTGNTEDIFHALNEAEQEELRTLLLKLSENWDVSYRKGRRHGKHKRHNCQEDFQ